MIARKLKGLEDIVSFSVVHWQLGDKGWRFVTPEDTDSPGVNAVPDPLPGHENYTHLRQAYMKADADFVGRVTVPVLWDKKRNTIVSNESSEIVRMFNTGFQDLLPEKYQKVDLYPAALQADIDAANEWHYDLINNGVYKSGFATKQEAYERNVVALFGALDRAEEYLGSNPGPFWFGKTMTEVDIRLFVTIIRFDVSSSPPFLMEQSLTALACLCPALQVQLVGYPLGLPAHAQVDAQPVLELPGLQGHDRLPAHQEPLHQKPHPDQPL